jgi:serine phosphatase RsbU (regulator of sigma subunit)
MKLRTQLILFFFLLAIIPIAGLTIYTYWKSQEAFKQAVRVEAEDLASEMGTRLDQVRNDLDTRLKKLGSNRLQKLMDKDLKKIQFDVEKVYEDFMGQLGDSAQFIEKVEYRPDPAVPVHVESEIAPNSVVFVMPGTEAAAPTIAEDNSQDEEIAIKIDSDHVILVRNRLIPPPPHPPERLANLDHKRKPYRREIHLERLTRELEKEVVESAKAEFEKVAEEAKRVQNEMEAAHWSLARKKIITNDLRCFDIASQVSPESGSKAMLTAQLNSGELLFRVLSLKAKDEKDIPFAIDNEGTLYTRDPQNKEKLEEIGVSRSNGGYGDDWIVVAKEEANSGMMFGVARPIGEGLQAIRQAAVMNLGYGLGIAALAMLGILPISRRMTRNLEALKEGTEKLSSGDLKARVPVRSNDEFGKLSQRFNQMAAALEQHQKNVVTQERLQKEIEMCRQIQEELLPRYPLKMAFAEVQGVSIPAREVGGDFFNYFSLPDGKIAVLIGDVSGKGVPAALLMANLQATLKAKLPISQDLAKLAEQLDEEIGSSTPAHAFLTLFMGVFDPGAGILKWVNAGHNPQYILSQEEKFETMDSTGRPLGLLPGGSYEEKSVKLSNGDSIFLYTDGLVEAENSQGVEFGSIRLEEVLHREVDSDPETILAEIEKANRKFRESVDSHDDATMLILKTNGSIKVS